MIWSLALQDPSNIATIRDLDYPTALFALARLQKLAKEAEAEREKLKREKNKR